MPVKRRHRRGIDLSDEFLAKSIEELESTYEEDSEDETPEEIATQEVEKAMESEPKAKKKLAETPNGDEDYDIEEGAKEKGKGKLKKKSLEAICEEYPEIKKSLDELSGMKDFAEAQGEYLDDLAKSIDDSKMSSLKFNMALAKAFSHLSEKMDSVVDTLMELRGKPAVQKSVVSQKSFIDRGIGGEPARTVQKSIEEIETGDMPHPKTVLKAIESLAMEGKATVQDVIHFEAGKTVRKSIQHLVEEKLGVSNLFPTQH